MPMQTVLHEVEMFSQLSRHKMQKKRTKRNIQCAWLIDEIEAHSRPI